MVYNIPMKLKQDVVCNNCNQKHDVYALRCPKCHNLNDQRPNYNFTRNMDWLSLLRQLLLCVGGYLLIQILSVILSLILTTYFTSLFINSGYALEDALILVTEELSLPKYLMLINGLTYLVTLIYVIVIALPYLKDLIKDYTKLKNIFGGVVGFLCLLGASVLYTTIISTFYDFSSNDNQNSIVAITKDFPFLSFLVFAIIGPIVEEFIYRVGLFNSVYRLNKRWLAYLITGVIFGFIHFNFTSSDMINELVNLPNYIISGLILSYIYENYSFAGSSIAHILNNVVSLISVFMIQN